MCTNCVTNTEALAINAAGVVTAANELRRVVLDALRGVPAYERRLRVWEANAGFLSSMGLDADELLGPRPVPTPMAAPIALRSGPAFLPA